MIKGSYYIGDNDYVPAVLIEELIGDKAWGDENIPLAQGKRVLLSVEFTDGQKRTLTAGEITKEEIANTGFPNIIPKGRFIREYVEVPSVNQGTLVAALGMEKIGVNFDNAHTDFTIDLPSPVSRSGKKFFIKDASGNVNSAGNKRIIIQCSALANSIQGIEFAVIESAFGSFEFISDGDQWLIVSAG